jgi:hypothetical protein
VRASDTSAGVTDTTSGWTQAALAVTSPSDAAFAAVVVSVAAAVANEVHYVDNIDLGPGASAVWTRGGLVGSTTVAILRSDGVYVRGATLSNGAVIPSPSQSAVVYDYEGAPNIAYTYTAVVSAVVGGATISSPTSAATGAVTLTLTDNWLQDPLDTTAALTVYEQDPSNTSQAERDGVWSPLQSQYAVITADTNVSAPGGGDRSFETQTEGEYQALKGLLNRQHVLLYRTTYGETVYVWVAGVRKVQLKQSPGDHPVREIQVSFVPVASP